MGSVVLLALAAACAKRGEDEREREPPAPAEPTLAERFGGHAILAAGELADARLSVGTEDGEGTAAQPIRELRLPDAALLVPPATAHGRVLTVGGLVDGGVFELAKPKCGEIRRWHGEIRVIETELCIAALDEALLLDAFPDRRLATSFSGRFSAHAASNVLRCIPSTIEVTGVVECEIRCCAPQLQCRFFSASLLTDSEPPQRRPDERLFIPCNTMNSCV